jgi:Ca2+-transporting ATPase
VGQIDPPRDEVRDAVAACRAPACARSWSPATTSSPGWRSHALGIAQAGDRAVDGAELEHMGEPTCARHCRTIAVFSRVQPAQKLRIVQALQARGDVVAMTGDGVNDAPALAQADVGVAMGITGTEVAKSAAKIVITDDNFATIVAAVEQGRVVYGNLKKVILYLFATSIDEVLVLLLALLAGYPLPLAAVQILWINIVTEGTLTVNLVMDPPDGDEMRRAPVPRDDPLLDRDAAPGGADGQIAVVATFGWFAWRSWAGRAARELCAPRPSPCWPCASGSTCSTASRPPLGAAPAHACANRWLLGGLAERAAAGPGAVLPPLNALFHTVPLPPATLPLLLAVASVVLWRRARPSRAGAEGRAAAYSLSPSNSMFSVISSPTAGTAYFMPKSLRLNCPRRCRRSGPSS